MLKKIGKTLAYLLLTILLLLAGSLVYSTITDFQPAVGSSVLNSSTKITTKPVDDNVYEAVIWNIGYAGLGKEMDFFNDGGKMVRATNEQATSYSKGINTYLDGLDSIDFVLLQEVDSNSKRSYYQDQVTGISNLFPTHQPYFAVNYKVDFVPVPLALPYTPYGKTYAGLLSLSKFPVQNAERVQYPGSFDWPTKIFMLDRCYLQQRIKLPNGKDLLIINTHNTAYDETGELKKGELEYLKKQLEPEIQKGNYIVVGGDFNQCPPTVSPTKFSQNVADGYTKSSITKDLLPSGFTIAADTSVSSNRSADFPVGDKTYFSTIDFFLTSPNIEILETKTLKQNFEYSDHEPVYLRFRIKQ